MKSKAISYKHLPSISILVICYNSEEYIEEALLSILAQDYEGKMECIIVDDASTDKTADKIRNFINAHGDSMDFTFIPLSKNVGQAKAMDWAMRHAKNEWFMYADSDDIQLPDRCRRSMALLSKYPKSKIMVSGARHMSATGKVLNSFQPPFYCSYEVAPDELYLENAECRVNNWLGAPPKIIGFIWIMHRSIFDAWGPLLNREINVTRFTQDVTWFMRAFLSGPELASKQAMLLYRQHSANCENRVFEGRQAALMKEKYNDTLMKFRGGAYVSKLDSLNRALLTPNLTDCSAQDIRKMIDSCQLSLNFYTMFADWWSCSIWQRLRRLIDNRGKVRPLHYHMGISRLLPLKVFIWLKDIRNKLRH